MYKKFLESQLQWSKNQSAVLEKMESKLHEMKVIAEIAVANVLSIDERGILKMNMIYSENRNIVNFSKSKVI